MAAAADEVDDRNERNEIGNATLLHTATAEEDEDEDDDAAVTEANSCVELTVTEDKVVGASPPDAAEGATSGAAEAAGAATAGALETGVEASVSLSVAPAAAQTCFAKARVACWSLELQEDSICDLMPSMKPVLPQMQV